MRATCAAKLISCARQHGGRLDASRRREHFSDGVESPGKSELLLPLAHQGQALLQQLAGAGVISFRARYVSEAEQHECDEAWQLDEIYGRVALTDAQHAYDQTIARFPV